MTKLFGTDGIRGNVGSWPLVPEFFLQLGKLVGCILKNEFDDGPIIIGRDTRASSSMLQAAFTSGISYSGIDVINVGVIPTSGIAWLVRNQKFAAGAMISASHNPLEQNGIKIFNSRGYKLPDDLEERIESFLLSEAANDIHCEANQYKFGRILEGAGFQEIYIHSLLSEHPQKFLTGIKIVVDCANGAASNLAPTVFTDAGAKVEVVYATPTGENINDKCGSEHVRRYPGKFAELINESNADFGIVFDGDADRVIFVDKNAGIIDGDHIIGMLASYFRSLDRLHLETVVTTTMRNSGLKKFLSSLGIKMFETPVGDKFVVEKLIEINSKNIYEGAVGLGGEQSGHIVILNDEFTTGDGMRTALFTIRAFQESGRQSISEFASMIGKTPQIIASAYVGSGARYSRKELDKKENVLLDENSAVTRANLRYSGTEPFFRVMLEAEPEYSEVDLARIATRVCRDVQSVSGVPEGDLDILDCCNGGYIDL